MTPSNSSLRRDGALLRELLARLDSEAVTPALLDAVAQEPERLAYPVSDQQVLTLDLRLCHPPLNDWKDFGRVGAAQALAGLYAAGARPLKALALLGLPDDPSTATLKAIEAGIGACCRDAGVGLAGVHVLPGVGMACGLLALGQFNPRNVRHGTPLRPGDRLVLGKPLGFGLYARALARGQVHHHDYREWLESMGRPNLSGPTLACLDGVHQLREVGEAGLRASLEDLAGADLSIRLQADELPLLHRAREWAGLDGVAAEGMLEVLLDDPQLSGGLLVACAPDTVTEVLSIFLQQGFGHAAVVGECIARQARQVVLA